MEILIILGIIVLVSFLRGSPAKRSARKYEREWKARTKRTEIEAQREREKFLLQKQQYEKEQKRKSRQASQHVQNNVILNELSQARNSKFENVENKTIELYNYNIQKLKFDALQCGYDKEVVTTDIRYRLVSQKQHLYKTEYEDLGGYYAGNEYFCLDALVRMFKESGALVELLENERHETLRISYYIGNTMTKDDSRKRVR